MAGAIAGTALVNFAADRKNFLTTVTLTINNVCNLSCPHCYLQYAEGYQKYISGDVLDALYHSDFNHLVIVGKEPFANAQSIKIVEEVASRMTELGRTVGVITNGFGLHRVRPELLQKLAYIDVSFDGGPSSYGNYRGGDFMELIGHLRVINERYGFNRFNALHVINDQTIGNLSDMLQVRDYFQFEHMMFSPYIETLAYPYRG